MQDVYRSGILSCTHGQASSSKSSLYSGCNVSLNTANTRESNFGGTGQSLQAHTLEVLGILRIKDKNYVTGTATYITAGAAAGCVLLRSSKRYVTQYNLVRVSSLRENYCWWAGCNLEHIFHKCCKYWKIRERGLETYEFFLYILMSLLKKIVLLVVLNFITFLKLCTTKCSYIFRVAVQRRNEKPTATLHPWMSHVMHSCDVEKGLMPVHNAPSWM